MNEIDAVKIGLPEGGKIRLISANKRWQYYFIFPMKISPNVEEGTVILPKLLNSLPFTQAKFVSIENAAKIISEKERFQEFQVDETALKSQAQLFEEFIREKSKLDKKTDDLKESESLKTEVSAALDNLEKFSRKPTEKNHSDQTDIEEKPLITNAQEYKNDTSILQEINIEKQEGLTKKQEKKSKNQEQKHSDTKEIIGSPIPESIPKSIANLSLEQYPDMIEISQLQQILPNSQITLLRVQDEDLGGNLQIHEKLAKKLNLFPGAFLGWEDPITRNHGIAPVIFGASEEDIIIMDKEMWEDNELINISEPKLVVYSMEPPIIQVKELTLKPKLNSDMVGKVRINFRNSRALGIKNGDVVALTRINVPNSRSTYSKVQVEANISDEAIEIDPNLLGKNIRSNDLVSVNKRMKKIVNLKKLYLGAELWRQTSESYNLIISNIQSKKESIKIFYLNYLIFPGLQVEHPDFQAIFKFKSCSPALGPQEIGKVTANSEIEIEIEGILPIDTIMVIDLTRSLLARDIHVGENYNDALKVEKFFQKLSLDSPFVKITKNTQLSRLSSILLFFYLYLLEKISRKLDERISVLVFSDKEEIIQNINQDEWLNTNIYSTSVLVSFIHNLQEKLQLESGNFSHFNSPLKDTRRLLKKMGSDKENRPRKLMLFTDADPDDLPPLPMLIKDISEIPDFEIILFGLGNFSLEEYCATYPEYKVEYHNIESLDDFIPLYRILATFKE
ncbi:MAG: hypothetical protein ACTSWC_10110 [Promethearchaeota archaeon]